MACKDGIRIKEKKLAEFDGLSSWLTALYEPSELAVLFPLLGILCLNGLIGWHAYAHGAEWLTSHSYAHSTVEESGLPSSPQSQSPTFVYKELLGLVGTQERPYLARSFSLAIQLELVLGTRKTHIREWGGSLS